MKINFGLPNGYHLRPARLEDLPAAVEMFNACSMQLSGVKEHVLQRYESFWTEPGFDLEGDTRVVIAPDGTLAAYYEVWDVDDPHVRIPVWGRVHPKYTGKGVGTALLHWAEARAEQSMAQAPEGARIVMVGYVLSIDQAARQLFLGQGYQFVRHSLRMVIDLNAAPPEPAWPQGIQVRQFVRHQDERVTILALRESFRDHWGYVEHPLDEELDRWEHFMETDVRFDPTLWYLAMDGDEVAGISLCYAMVDDDPDMGWVGSLGVRRPWRYQGLGLALLQHSFREFYQLGKLRVGLGVDAESLTGATRLYLKAGMRSDPRREFSLFEKELRPGFDMSTQTVAQEATQAVEV
jgi:GNAT superfamily N-acetyltransferase